MRRNTFSPVSPYPISKVKNAFKSPVIKSPSSVEQPSINPEQSACSSVQLQYTPNVTHNRICTNVSTPKGKSSTFRTPFRNPTHGTPTRASMSPEQQLKELQKTEILLDQKIASLQDEGLSVDELDTFIDKLHKYNDIKDAAQTVLGKLAELEGASLKEVHERYNVLNNE